MLTSHLASIATPMVTTSPPVHSKPQKELPPPSQLLSPRTIMHIMGFGTTNTHTTPTTHLFVPQHPQPHYRQSKLLPPHLIRTAHHTFAPDITELDSAVSPLVGSLTPATNANAQDTPATDVSQTPPHHFDLNHLHPVTLNKTTNFIYTSDKKHCTENTKLYYIYFR